MKVNKEVSEKRRAIENNYTLAEQRLADCHCDAETIIDTLEELGSMNEYTALEAGTGSALIEKLRVIEAATNDILDRALK